ncbi:hypothetical protein B484DRAFT_436416, partial [Ochromonadaceae sp. CCMP2298]
DAHFCDELSWNELNLLLHGKNGPNGASNGQNGPTGPNSPPHSSQGPYSDDDRPTPMVERRKSTVEKRQASVLQQAISQASVKTAPSAPPPAPPPSHAYHAPHAHHAHTANFTNLSHSNVEAEATRRYGLNTASIPAFTSILSCERA